MDWITVKEASEIWGLSIRRVQVLCENGQVNGAERLGNMWVIPKGALKPIDGRTRVARNNKDKIEKHGGNKT